MLKKELFHIGFIPDGNNRWAVENDKSIFYAYRQGAERAKEAIKHSDEAGIHTLTFWALSTENWRGRPKGELDFLVSLFVELTDEYLQDAGQHGVRVVHLGRKDRLPGQLVERLEAVERETAENTEHTLNLALDYGGQDEIIRATHKIIGAVASGSLDPSQLEETVASDEDRVPKTVYSKYLDTSDQPHPFPDFVVRTSGEMRLSGFLPWQSVYAELYFAPCFWPDFGATEFETSLEIFQDRNRRFGGGHVGEEGS